jgi:hypothetical protein
VNGEPILEAEVSVACYQDLQGVDDAKKAKFVKAKVREIVGREVFLQNAFLVFRLYNQKAEARLVRVAEKEFQKQWVKPMMEANHCASPAELKRYLDAGGLPLDVARRHWERNYLAQQIMRVLVADRLDGVTRADAVSYYKSHPEEFRVPDSITWQDLFIANVRHSSRDEARLCAEKILGRVREGEDFVSLSHEHDDGVGSLHENSEGTGRLRGEIRPVQLEAQLFRMKEGESALVALETGFHVVRVLKRQQAGLRPLDPALQKEILDQLRARVYKRESRRIVAEMKRQANIEYEGQE